MERALDLEAEDRYSSNSASKPDLQVALRKSPYGSGEMPQWLREFAALLENSNSVPRTYTGS